jgi:hypothetical protein
MHEQNCGEGRGEPPMARTPEPTAMQHAMRSVESAGELAAGGVEREYAGGRVKEVDIAGRSGNDEVTELRTVVQASECAC